MNIPADDIAGPECPACHSTKTKIEDFRQEIVTTNSIGAAPINEGRNPRYTLVCLSCRKETAMHGNPWNH
jgi:hypothetical protein